MSRRRKPLDSNTWLSIMATVVSACALFVAVYQTRIMRQQQDAAVWPKLLIEQAYYNQADFYRLRVRNVGVGPAVIVKTTIWANGRQYADMQAYAKAILARLPARDSVVLDYADLTPDDVVPPGERVGLFTLERQPAAAQLLIRNIPRFELRIEYASIYGQRWTTTYPKRTRSLIDP